MRRLARVAVDRFPDFCTPLCAVFPGELYVLIVVLETYDVVVFTYEDLLAALGQAPAFIGLRLRFLLTRLGRPPPRTAGATLTRFAIGPSVCSSRSFAAPDYTHFSEGYMV